MTDLGPIVLAIVAVLYVLRAARNSNEQASSDSSDNVVFALAPSFRIGLNLAALAFAGGALLSFLDRAPGWTSATLAGAALVSAAVHYVIVLTPHGVECRRAWGLFTTRISWPDIESVWVMPGEGTIIVEGRSGNRISYSNYHVDTGRFLAELSNRRIVVNRQGDL